MGACNRESISGIWTQNTREEIGDARKSNFLENQRYEASTHTHSSINEVRGKSLQSIQE